jgi:glycogen debranching enzyme
MGAVWAPTNTMIIKGLEKYGYKNQARDIAMNHLRNVITVYKETGTIWENYSADYVTPGDVAKAEFVGWSGIAPINYFFEYAIGIKANAPDKIIEWTINSQDNVGIKKFWFGGITTDLICSNPDKNGKRKIKVTSDGNYTLKILYNGNEIIKKINKGGSTTIKL